MAQTETIVRNLNWNDYDTGSTSSSGRFWITYFNPYGKIAHYILIDRSREPNDIISYGKTIDEAKEAAQAKVSLEALGIGGKK